MLQTAQDGVMSDRPLIFIGHSFGGLIVEQAVVKANSSSNMYRYIVELIGGVVFLGTPHRGSKSQKWGSILAHLAKLIELGETTLMADVDEKSTKIFDLVFEFMRVMIRLDLVWNNAAMCFCENLPTNYLRRVVRIGFEKQMSSMVRFF
jgi:pimeloyl-ACP methyl ester carboxylesterase